MKARAKGMALSDRGTGIIFQPGLAARLDAMSQQGYAGAADKVM